MVTPGPRPWAIAAVLVAIIALLGAMPLLKGGFYLGKHEGDTLHLAELVLRMAGGEWPHLDFMTPIGVMALAPIVWFVDLGMGLGHAIFWAQILVAAALLPGVMWVVGTRVPGWWGLAYGAFVMILCLALVHGEAERAVSISMHYNRWAWAVAYVIVPVAVLAPFGRVRPGADGLIVGLGMAMLALMKVTYFAALAPGVVIALLARRQWGTLAVAALAGLVVAGIVTAMAGPAFWLAYLDDLRTVAASDIRPQPGEEFGSVLAAPLYMGGTLTLIATVILLRQAGRMVEGMALLFLMPGFFYITYQNFGNDPQWLLLVGILAFLLRPVPGTVNGRGWDLRDGLRIAGILALAFGAPSALNLAYSPFRHMATDETDYVPLLPGLAAHHDVLTIESRLYRVEEQVAGDLPGSAFVTFRDRAKREHIATLNGATLPECMLDSGMNAWFKTVATDLEAAGFGGSAVLGTDLFSLYWAFGDFRPVKGAAPWYYGGLSGVENADYVVVPMCPMAVQIRAGMLDDLAKGGWTVTEVRRTPLYALLKVAPPS